MKKIALLSLVWVLTSCSHIITRLDRVDNLSTVDFRNYSKNNFMFTPEKYLGDYESIGLVNYVAIGSAEYRVVTKEEYEKSSEYYFLGEPVYTVKKGDKLYAFSEKISLSANVGNKQWFAEIRPLQNAVDSLYVRAKHLGADAIINFKAVEEIKSVTYPIVPETIFRIKYTLSGFAIKRK